MSDGQQCPVNHGPVTSPGKQERENIAKKEMEKKMRGENLKLPGHPRPGRKKLSVGEMTVKRMYTMPQSTAEYIREQGGSGFVRGAVRIASVVQDSPCFLVATCKNELTIDNAIRIALQLWADTVDPKY